LTDGITRLLDRLDKVRQCAPDRWMACCPVHGDKRPSLSIRLAEDGRILLNCFAEKCAAIEIVQAVGLEVADLFPRPDTHEPRKHVRQGVTARELLDLVAHEALVVMILAEGVIENHGIAPECMERLTAAVRRIGYARDHAGR
jgi:hypothetical protein